MKHCIAARSDFSMGQSLLQVDKAVAKAKELGYTSMALTDTFSLHAMVDFNNRCKKAGIKPVTACVVNLYDDPTYRKEAGKKMKRQSFVAVKVYVLNERGLEWLMKLLTKASSQERFYYTPRATYSDFKGAEGIAVSTGDFFNLFANKNHDKILKILSHFVGKENIYVEMSPVNSPLFDRTNALAADAAHRHGLKTMLSYPVLCMDESESESLDILNLIISNGRTNERTRPIQYVKDFHMHSPSEINRRIMDAAKRAVVWEGQKKVDNWAAAVAGTDELVSRVEYSFEKMPVNLPQMAPDEFVALVNECKVGWKTRFEREVMGYKPDMTDPDVLNTYKSRLAFELNVLKSMGFSGYFLLAQDIVMWSKANGIIVGPGRGSVGGSLVAYLIGITDVDPIRFGLLFERFINPSRIDLPDADLDFMSSRRHEVIDYLVEKYGRDRVAGISNYGTLASASAFRDTGRVFGLTPIEMTATKLVPKEHGQPVGLEEAAEQVPEIEMLKRSHPVVWRHAKVFEGCMRSFGKHAAGIVVSRDPLVTRAVVENRDGNPVVSWDKRVVEDFGLVKLDILGLSTLDVLFIAKNYIKERHGQDLDYLSIPLEDEEVMDAFGRGDTTGVFQFESSGMRDLLKKLAKGGRLTFDDIAAATALYRPGPMDSGLLDDFVAIKQGHRLPSYDHPLMEPALKDTYGVIVYQEQVMQIAVDLAGFTKAEADNLRKAMGKKDKEKMSQMRQQWIDGCWRVAEMQEAKAGSLFDKIEAFAGYGFNKSHAVEYSIISYWTMWLRVKFGAEYFAACMSIVDSDKLPGLVKDAREAGIEVLPPDINLSGVKFEILSNTEILAPFSAVMGISENIANKIVLLRKTHRIPVLKSDGKPLKEGGVAVTKEPKGRFDTFEEFAGAAATKGSGVNVRAVERLELVGAMANITPGSKPARHPDRRKDQTELMPGLIIDSVKADRYTDMTDGFVKTQVIHLVQDYASCEACSLKNSPHPAVRIPRSKVKFMVITDSPSWEDERDGKMLSGDTGRILTDIIKEASLSVGEGYYTTLVKARKPKGEKFLSNEMINGCKQFLDQELALIKPAVIVALGSAASRYFAPDAKGGIGDLAGKVIFDPKRDASIVFGINPAQVLFDPSKVDSLVNTFAKVAEIVN